jgi:hypothetical protein
MKGSSDSSRRYSEVAAGRDRRIAPVNLRCFWGNVAIRSPPYSQEIWDSNYRQSVYFLVDFWWNKSISSASVQRNLTLRSTLSVLLLPVSFWETVMQRIWDPKHEQLLWDLSQISEEREWTYQSTIHYFSGPLTGRNQIISISCQSCDLSWEYISLCRSNCNGVGGLRVCRVS